MSTCRCGLLWTPPSSTKSMAVEKRRNFIQVASSNNSALSRYPQRSSRCVQKPCAIRSERGEGGERQSGTRALLDKWLSSSFSSSSSSSSSSSFPFSLTVPDWSERVDEVRPLHWTRALAAGVFASAFVLGVSMCGAPAAEARLEGVNRPELLPKKYTPLIDVAGFLTDGEEQRIIKTLERLEQDTGIKLRVLAQNYPETPGLAIKDFWKVDARTVVLVADPNTGNITNFNVGDDVDIEVPRNFWSKVAGRFGNKFYWKDEGPDRAILNSVNAIDFCLREPESRLKCTKLNTLEDAF